jgi:hypothetical protein
VASVLTSSSVMEVVFFFLFDPTLQKPAAQRGEGEERRSGVKGKLCWFPAGGNVRGARGTREAVTAADPRAVRLSFVVLLTRLQLSEVASEKHEEDNLPCLHS